jgi:hypothetical protein
MGALRPLGRREEECSGMVSDFIQTTGGSWDEEKLRRFFFEEDVSNILRIPVGRPGSQDVVAWNYTKNGIFSVKSAYHLAVQRKRAASGAVESSMSGQDHGGWLALWGGSST